MKQLHLSLVSSAAFAASFFFETTHLQAEPIVYHDDFEAGWLGEQWTVAQGPWWVEDNHLVLGLGSGISLVYFNEAELNIYPFKVEADIAVTRASGWGGIAFHAQNVDTFYALRLRPDQDRVQFLRQFEGSTSAPINHVVDDFSFAANEKYRFRVVSMEPGEFEISLRDMSGKVLFSMTHTATDFSAGYAGFHGQPHSSEDNMRADNFTLVLNYDPEDDDVPPNEDHPFEVWRRAHFTEAELLEPEVSGPDANPIGDGLANLVKFALGMDPWEPRRDAAPAAIWDMDRIALVFTAPEERPGVELVLAVSNDLFEWDRQVIDETYEGWGSVAVGDGREEISVRPDAAGGDRQFLRLEVRLVDHDDEVPAVLIGEWLMDELIAADDHQGNSRNAVPDESGNERHLILGNRPSVEVAPDPDREPALVAREDGQALSFDGIDDVAHVNGIWNMDEPQQHYSFSFWFSPQAPLSGDQTILVTPEHFEVRMVRNTPGTHARLWFIRYPSETMDIRAHTHWFYQDGDDLDTWYFVEGWIADGEMEITVNGQRTGVGTYDANILSAPHHNTIYVGQTSGGSRSFNGKIDEFRVMERE